MKKMRKVNPKDTAKAEVMSVIIEALENNGFEVTNSPEDYGLTKNTIIVHHSTCDVQIKPITPKVGVTRYEAIED